METSVWVIDDAKSQVEDVFEALRELNVPGQFFWSLEAAEQRLQEGEGCGPEAIVLDLMFPEDADRGLNYLRRIREGTSGFRRRIGIVVYTNAEDEDTQARATAAGANCFIGKTERRRRRLLNDSLREVLYGVRILAEEPCEVVEIEESTGEAVVLVRDEGECYEKVVPLELIPLGCRAAGLAFALRVSSVGDADHPSLRVEARALGETMSTEAVEMLRQLRELGEV